MFAAARRRLWRLLVAAQVALLVSSLVGPSVALATDPGPDPGGAPPAAAEPTPTPAPDATPEATPEPTPAPDATPSADPTPAATPGAHARAKDATPEATPAGPAISTDLLDYWPGATVHIGGWGWTPGAPVDLALYRDDPGDGIAGFGAFPSLTWTVTAGDAGTIDDSSLVVTFADWGVRFRLVATGPDGTAEAFFADSALTDCFRTVASGSWSDIATWESAPTSGGCTAWSAATLTPTSGSNTIQVRSGHTVHVTGAVTVDQVTVDSGGDLVVDSGVTLTTANGTGVDLADNGAVNVFGTLAHAASSATTVNGSLTVKSGGLVNGNGGSASTKPAFTVGPGGTWAVNAGGAFTTGGSGPMTVTVSSGGTAVIDGPVSNTIDLTVDGTLTSSATITMGSVSTLLVGGTVTMTAGTLSVSRGNGGTMGSIASGGSLVLQGSSIFTLSGAATASYTVASGGTLDIGPSALVNGTSSLIVAAGATIRIGSADGIEHGSTLGNVRTTSATADSYSTAANYEYTGTAAQATGNALPTTVNNLTVSNTGGAVTPTSNLAVGGTLSVLSDATFSKVGAYALTIGPGGVSNAGTIALDGGAAGCGSADDSLIRSTVGETQRSWSGAGTFSLQDVDVRDQAGSASIVALSSTSSGNNGANWTISAGCALAPSTTTVTFEAGPYVYRGTAFTATATVTGSGGLNESVPVVYSGDCTNVTVANGCTATATFAGDATHTGSSDSKSITITKATATIGVTGYSVTYDGSSHTATGTATGVGGADLAAGLDLSGTVHTNAGSYGTDPWSFTGGANYDNDSGTVADNIGAASSTTAVTCPVSVVYTGSAIELCTAEATGAGMSPLDVSASLVYGSNVAVGTASADASWVGDANHLGSSGSGSFDIGKAASTTTVTFEAGPYTYRGTAFTASATVTGAGGLSQSVSGRLQRRLHERDGGERLHRDGHLRRRRQPHRQLRQQERHDRQGRRHHQRQWLQRRLRRCRPRRDRQRDRRPRRDPRRSRPRLVLHERPGRHGQLDLHRRHRQLQR